LGLRGVRYQGSGENYIMRSLLISTKNLEDHIKRNKRRVMCKDRTGAYRVLVVRPEGRRPFGRPMICIWEDNIKTDQQEVGWGARIRRIWLRIGTGGRLL